MLNENHTFKDHVNKVTSNESNVSKSLVMYQPASGRGTRVSACAGLFNHCNVVGSILALHA